MNNEKHFEFGKNWQRFLEGVDKEAIAHSRRYMEEFFGTDSFEGKTFIDIGCGSGLSSFAVWQMGVESLYSFDYDDDSVSATRSLHERCKKPENWTVTQGDVLDPDFMGKLPQFDIVHSWGVLHHTGGMWDAIRNAAALTKPDGLYMIGIYNKKLPYTKWMKEVKRVYTHSGSLVRVPLKWSYFLTGMAYRAVKGKRILDFLDDYKQQRGMDYWRDLEDWLGGYPYEYATPEEVISFVESLGFQTVKTVRVTTMAGVNQFLFRRLSA